jgi:peptidoglycan/xylan/chitin deacetylase (PgdA/CDA1 family)
MALLKRAALAVVSRPGIGRLLGRLRAERGAILMLHRFARPAREARPGDGDPPTHGHDPQRLRSLLAYLRATGVQLVQVEELIEAYRSPEPRPGPMLAFTVDDCYPDLLDIGAPVFAEFDCPVTGFVVPGVVDGASWFWWDQIEWIARHAARPALRAELGPFPVHVTWTDVAGRAVAVHQLCETIKRVSTAERIAGVEALAQAADVAVPADAPPEYRVLGWDRLRAAERAGMRFGPHTMSHPVLSRCTDAEAEREIRESVDRIRAEFSSPSRVFCYPVGMADHLGDRDVALVEAAGMDAAVTAQPGLLAPEMEARHGADWRFRVPRFAYDERQGVTARLLLL